MTTPLADRPLDATEQEYERANPRGRAKRGGRKSVKRYREPFEYSQVLRASGVTADERQLVSRYYRERALPHVVPFPSRNVPQAVDPQPEGTEMWDVGSPLESIDWLATVLESPIVIPGVTTRERLYGTSPGSSPERVPVDLNLGVDCSGSMGNPAHAISYPVLAGAIIALSALRAGSRVMVALSGEPGSTVTTEGFIRDKSAVLATLTGYLGTGYSFGIHRLRDVFENRAPGLREVHILIVSDNDMFSMLEQRIDGQLGWDVARESVARARGGGTYVLQLPAHARWEQNLNRMRGDAWQVSLVTSQEDLVEFARAFAQANYARLQEFPPLPRGD